MAEPKIINVALQGGGAHGAFTWGVLDRFLSDPGISIEAISGTSAGSMNAVVVAYGLAKGGRDGARDGLKRFWKAVHRAGRLYNPVQRLPWETFWSGLSHGSSFAYDVFTSVTRFFSPYVLNPLDINPLRDVLDGQVDFDDLNGRCPIKLFVSATNVRNGQVRVFSNREVTADAVMASCCLPYIYKAVCIDGEYYWDGGYMGNPVLFPFFYDCESRDILIVHVNPIQRPAPPVSATDIFNRINEISFNASLLKELRAISFVHKLLDQDWIKEEHRHRLRYMLVHSVRADIALSDLSTASKFDSDWPFLKLLRDRGRVVASEWLRHNRRHLGVRSTVDLQQEFLDLRP